ncbi:MAG: lysophospholipid acyltransferase family protein [Phormidesmis sp.]
MSLTNPLEVSRWMLFSMGIRIRVHHSERLPRSPFLMISNHRSFLDAPLLIAAAAKPVHFACHHYMAQVPVMRNVVDALGCFPLDEPNHRGRTFFKQATGFLRSHESIGVFPEGTGPMVKVPLASEVGPFHRGFAHLALRAPVENLQVVPTAIVALEEVQQDAVPFKLLSWFDPTEPLFNQSGRHPAVIYQRVTVVIGQPIAITDSIRQDYRGRKASGIASELSDQCHDEIQSLLKAGCY